MTKAILNEKGFAKNAGWLTVYNYDAETKEFTSSNEEWICKDTGIPAHSTSVKPPGSKEGFAICKAEFREGWIFKEDHRGETAYDKETGNPVIIKTIGPLDDSLTALAPATQHDHWDGRQWITDETAVAAEKREQLLFSARNKIGFWQTKLQLGIITPKEKEALILWIHHIDALTNMDMSDVYAITWPMPPETD